MAQSGYTPISLYFSTTAAAAPSAGNLVAGELALNTVDEKLYFKNSAGTVKLLASNAGSAGSVTSVAQTFTGGIVSVGGSPITTSGTLALTVAGTSGGVPYFSSGTTWATSAALAASAIVLGGGAGAAPATTTTGTGVVTALGVAVGTAGAFVVNGGALGSPSSAGTIPAFTLGGTVAGGGNQINNVIIGTTTPLAGAFTTVVATKATAGDVITFTNGGATPKAGYLYSASNFSGLFADASAAGTGVAMTSGTSTTIFSPDQTKSLAVSNTGTAVTGALSATGAATLSSTLGVTGDATISNATGAGGRLNLISTDTGGVGYALVSGGSTNTAFPTGALTIRDTTVGANRLVISSTGLAVTGTLSATGTLSGGTSGTGYSFSGSAPAGSLALTSGGDLGVGTASPTSRLHVSTGNGDVARIAGTTRSLYFGADSAGMMIATGATQTGVGMYYSAGGDFMYFMTGSTERARIDSSGNLMVGTTSASGSGGLAKLTLDGTRECAVLKSSGGASYSPLVVWNTATSGNNYFAYFTTEGGTYPGTERGSITYNRAGGLTAYNTTSDYRAKDISGPVTGSGALIDSVPVYMGKMKDATQERPMFIAHEVPAYAHTGEKDAVDADGNPVYQQMDASALIPVMWAELQSLRARVAQLESKP